MKFKEIMAHLTGFSTPFFGISWNPPKSERSIARQGITYLEDRRVLFVPSEMEMPSHCVQSILQIRRFLTDQLGQLENKNDLSETVKAMRAACRKFLSTVDADERTTHFGGYPGHWASWTFNGALGELRGVFGICIAKISAQYGVDIDDELASIIPGKDE